tara:strand:- start:1698 stop:2132 length:435 start_codon:yes stop_codon:yes gene_type:complete
MKITKPQLKQIIKEELQQVLNETEELNEMAPLAGLAAHALRTKVKELLIWMIPGLLRDPKGALRMGRDVGYFYLIKKGLDAAGVFKDSDIPEKELNKIIGEHVKIILKTIDAQAASISKELNKLDPGIAAGLKASSVIKVKNKK